jgi:hypothetical protein
LEAIEPGSANKEELTKAHTIVDLMPLFWTLVGLHVFEMLIAICAGGSLTDILDRLTKKKMDEAA